MRDVLKVLSLTTAALLFVSAPVRAQQQDITAEDVQSYVERIRQDAAALMDAEEPEQLVAWAQRNIAEGATFQVSISILADDERKAYAAMTVDTQDIQGMVGMLAGAFQQGAFEDYSLEAEVADVVSVGPGAATATVTWIERFRLNTAALLGDGGQTLQGEALAVEAAANCTHLFQQHEDQMQIGLSTCSVEMRL